jgi:hypothetical protein
MDWHSIANRAVLSPVPGAGRPEILPRRLHGRDGASVVRCDAAINRTEDLNVKVREATNNCIIRSVCSVLKSCATGC